MCSLQGNQLKEEGAKHVANAIATNTTLKELKYALSHPQPCYQHPLTSCTLACSIDINQVGPEGAKALGESLKTNSSLQTLKYAVTHPSLAASTR